MVKRHSWIVFAAVLVAFLGFIAITRVRTAERERGQLLRTMADAKVLESYILSRVQDGKYPTTLPLPPLNIGGHTIEFTLMAGVPRRLLGNVPVGLALPPGKPLQDRSEGWG